MMYTNLYKGRYMIALYDEDDNIVDCFLNINELCEKFNLKLETCRSIISRLYNEKLLYTTSFGKELKVHFIDCLPQHDQFYYEDIQFLKRFGCRKVYKEFIRECGISERTFYRNKDRYEAKIKENMEMAEM